MTVVFGNTGDYGRDNEYNIAVANVLRSKGAEFTTTSTNGSCATRMAMGLSSRISSTVPDVTRLTISARPWQGARFDSTPKAEA